jgi:hypothetical protein
VASSDESATVLVAALRDAVAAYERTVAAASGAAGGRGEKKGRAPAAKRAKANEAAAQKRVLAKKKGPAKKAAEEKPKLEPKPKRAAAEARTHCRWHPAPIHFYARLTHRFGRSLSVSRSEATKP